MGSAVVAVLVPQPKALRARDSVDSQLEGLLSPAHAGPRPDQGWATHTCADAERVVQRSPSAHVRESLRVRVSLRSRVPVQPWNRSEHAMAESRIQLAAALDQRERQVVQRRVVCRTVPGRELALVLQQAHIP